MNNTIKKAVKARDTKDHLSIIPQLFEITDFLYEKELKELDKQLQSKIEKAQNKFVKLFRWFGESKAVSIFDNSKKYYGSISFYKSNPLLFMQDNPAGLWHLKEAFMGGSIISQKQTVEILNRFIERRKHLLK